MTFCGWESVVVGILFNTSNAVDIPIGDILITSGIFWLPPDSCGLQHNYE
jgi:hypothetical protein